MTHEQALTTLASERYLLDEMNAAERETFEEHYFSCTACAEDVRTAGLMRDGAKAGLLQEQERGNASSRVVPFRPRQWYRSPALPWALAATLALVAGYQSLVTVPSLRPLNEPRALAPITLRPASRGQEARIAIGPDSAAMTLAVDASSTVSSGELSYDLRTAAGFLVLSGKAAAPSAGAPLLLLVPARAVSAPGRYVLSVGGNDYAFEVVAQ
jgi:anti-sigma factor RsiW